MKSVQEIITNNKEKFEHFQYYDLILEKIEKNASKNPDICIESCKSLIEGISKTILKALDNTFNEKDVNKQNVMPIFKDAVKKLAEHDENIEEDFINRAGSLVHLFGTIRNERGDISHGKLAPKQILSTPEFSKLCVNITEGVSYYMIKSFFDIDLSYKQPLKYDDNSEFNQELDEENSLDYISYSKALFDQDLTLYEELLDSFNEKNELEDEYLV